LGKLSFDSNGLMENLATVVETIVKARPSGAKGHYVKSASLTTSMGPGIKLDLKTTLALRAP
jgi:large subunit ribosomal protein L1